jgi:leukotriene-A4 hydrolase
LRQLTFLVALMTKHTAVFLERLETYPALPTSHVLHLDALYRFSRVTNSEIRMPFYLVALKDPASHVAKRFVQAVLDWVIGKDTGIIQGRMKFCRPLFRAAAKVDREKTVAAYCSARTLFHPIARKLIEQEVRRSCLSTLDNVADDGLCRI